MVTESQIAESERGHRRGVVLGFTLAELLLLLLFCMLLITAGTFRQQESELESLRTVINSQLSEREIEELTRRAAAAVPAKELLLLQQKSAEFDRFLALMAIENSDVVGGDLPDKIWDDLRLATEATALLGQNLAEVDWTQVAALVETVQTLKLTPEQVSQTMKSLDQMNLTKLTQQQLVTRLKDSDESGSHSWPPIINLEDNGFSFSLGSAEIRPEFKNQLTSSVTTQLRELLNQYDVDVIEIVGHTDEQPISPTRPSNLDSLAIEALWGHVPYAQLIPVDNAGLGLARAIAVANTLAGTGLFEGVTIIPYSAAQLVMPGDNISRGLGAVDDKIRRRIEIRVRRTTPSMFSREPNNRILPLIF